jgi:hypothetical protein
LSAFAIYKRPIFLAAIELHGASSKSAKKHVPSLTHDKKKRQAVLLA